MSRRLLPAFALATFFFSALITNIGVSAASATPTPGASTTTSDACNNKYYPVVKDAVWDYTVTGSLRAEYAHSITNVTPDGFTDQDVFSSGITRTGEWSCDDGGLTALQPDADATGSLQSRDLNAVLRKMDVSGVTVPDQLLPGTIWNQMLSLNGVERVSGNNVPAADAITLGCTATDMESVTVPAGIFNAIRGNCKYEEQITLTGTAHAPTDVLTTSTVWYAQGIGLIKAVDVTANGLESTVELTAVKIP